MNNATSAVAAIQFVSEFGQPEANRARLGDWVRAASKAGAQIMVLPELAVHGYMSEDGSMAWRRDGWNSALPPDGVDPHGVAETIPGPTSQYFASLARETQTILTAPILEHDPKTDRFYNAVLLIGTDGQTLLHYRKLNPWPLVEAGWAESGDRGLQFVDTVHGRLGVLICYDIHFEVPKLKAMGVDTLLFSSAWFDTPGSDFFQTQLPEMAREFEINIVAANWAVSKRQRWHGYGGSAVIDRKGKILAQAGAGFGSQLIVDCV